MLSGLNHLTLAVSQLAPSVAFYQQLLGMTLHARWDSGAYLSCGDLWLCLSLDPQRRVTPPERATTPIMRLALAKPISLLHAGSLAGRRSEGLNRLAKAPQASPMARKKRS
jgi:catechol 2,3-dioxygenase-like lactoylglutathione lyase family enzyme